MVIRKFYFKPNIPTFLPRIQEAQSETANACIANDFLRLFVNDSIWDHLRRSICMVNVPDVDLNKKTNHITNQNADALSQHKSESLT